MILPSIVLRILDSTPRRSQHRSSEVFGCHSAVRSPRNSQPRRVAYSWTWSHEERLIVANRAEFFISIGPTIGPTCEISNAARRYDRMDTSARISLGPVLH